MGPIEVVTGIAQLSVVCFLPPFPEDDVVSILAAAEPRVERREDVPLEATRILQVGVCHIGNAIGAKDVAESGWCT